ncbi:uncharacterized protein RAG0_08134 [Rhynchosporium agropyri]|uniref:Ubiquitin-like domain-containing protein n=1 Tax=Rhynchosporium agropyri TaxID=914238 RepID=A0A1E1KSC0_9HELO|nr:uncharacterized protein RAG0_08134 [Rhynchosporium agropyri]
MAESSEATQLDAQTKGDETPASLRFLLHVVSPSVGVSGPLIFPDLLATTTVKELKSRIRDVLPSKPPDENQRLIHRGRMLARETETMLEIFGQGTLSDAESQTLHLVLRPTGPEATFHPAISTPIPVPQQPTANPQIPPQFPSRPQSTPLNPSPGLQDNIHGMQAQQPLPGFQQQIQNQHQQLHQAQQVAHFQQGMVHRLGQLQQETQRLQQEIAIFERGARAATNAIQNGQPAPVGPGIPPQSIFRPAGPPPVMPPSIQNLINQQQRERAIEGRQGAQDTGGLPQFGQFPQTASGRASPSTYRPDSSTTHTREGVGPNGARWSVTVNETITTIPFTQTQPQHHPAPNLNPALDIQAVLRNADRLLAQNGQNNMQRAASNPVPTQPTSGIHRPETPGQATPTTTSSSSPASTIPNPLLNVNLPVINAPAETTASGSSSSTPSQPTVYLLSSPSGPRALLVTNTETYFTPRHSSRRRLPATSVLGQAPGGAVAFPEYRNRPAQRAVQRNAQPDAAQAAPQPVPNAPHGNPPAAALGAQIGPMIWLLVRLGVFVWFFTSGDPSWTRWLIIAGLGVVVLIYNTGVLNGIGNEVFGPIRRYLDNLIPLAGPEAALIPAQNAAILPAPARDAAAGGLTPQQRQRGELDPAEAADRIIEQRRQRLANGGWLIAQIRRVEHSLLLFLASLWPGVGERHIAAREAAANAAEAARRATVAAAEAAEQAANPATAEASGGGEAEGTEGTDERKEDDAHELQNNEPAVPAQPLVQM